MLIGRYAAVLDANVLHPATLRGALLWLAHELLFRPLWSEPILDEWDRSLRRKFPELTDVQMTRQRGYFGSFEDAFVSGQPHFAQAANLPDPGDAHIFATAIAGRADAIVTFNIKDFPVDVAAELGIEIIHPDDFIVAIIDLDPARALRALRTQRSGYKNPEITPERYVEKLLAMGLIQTYHRLLPELGLL